jgi:hypothetical protein
MILLDDTLGLDFVNEHMIELANYLKTFWSNQGNSLVQTGMSIGALFSVFVAAIEIYKVMAAQEGHINVLAIMRPVAFAFAMSQWTVLVNVIYWPGEQVEAYLREKFEEQKVEIVDLRKKRVELSMNIRQAIMEKKAAADEAERQMNGDRSWLTTAWDFLTDAGSEIKGVLLSVLATLQSYWTNLVEECIQWLGELVWQLAICYIFLIRACYAAVLVMFGPLWMGASVLPAWKDAWSQWVSKMITVSMYGGIAYLVLAFSCQLIKYGIEYDNKILQQMVDDSTLIVAHFNSVGVSTIWNTIAMLTGALALFQVPEMASLCWPGGGMMHGAGQFISGMTKMPGSAAAAGVKIAAGAGA